MTQGVSPGCEGASRRVMDVLAHQPETRGPGEQTAGPVVDRAVPARDVTPCGDVRAESGDTGEAETVAAVFGAGEDGNVLVPGAAEVRTGHRQQSARCVHSRPAVTGGGEVRRAAPGGVDP